MLTLNSPAPDFSLPDQEGKIHKLSDYKGQWVILYFYPKDDTPGCTKEACTFRDISAEFAKKNAVILGVSKDTVASHSKFASKFKLNFPLLSDPSAETIKAYDSYGEKKFMGRTFQGTIRNTVLIDPEGKVKRIYEKVNPTNNPQEVLNDIG